MALASESTKTATTISTRLTSFSHIHIFSTCVKFFNLEFNFVAANGNTQRKHRQNDLHGTEQCVERFREWCQTTKPVLLTRHFHKFLHLFIFPIVNAKAPELGSRTYYNSHDRDENWENFGSTVDTGEQNGCCITQSHKFSCFHHHGCISFDAVHVSRSCFRYIKGMDYNLPRYLFRCA